MQRPSTGACGATPAGGRWRDIQPREGHGLHRQRRRLVTTPWPN
jgi:hypothetical protein